ncbi:MAG: hypothetical protein ACK2UI_00815 [Anaerolineae bacterium]|jgi:hypothetical protein
MPIYVIVAYIIFCLTPLGLAFSIVARRRKVEREIAVFSSSETS